MDGKLHNRWAKPESNKPLLDKNYKGWTVMFTPFDR